MARTYSQMIDLGTRAPGFDLPIANPSVDGRSGSRRRLEDFDASEALLVVFTCNHCPYAQHVEPALIALARDYTGRGVDLVAINSNDPETYPEDDFDHMAERARKMEYPYPYLFDEQQEVARAYGAVCTPDLFLFDRGRVLVYRGRVDASRPGKGEATGEEIREAIDQLLRMGSVSREQAPSMGCNIKWRPGNEPPLSMPLFSERAGR